MKKLISYILVGLVCYFMLLLATIPASFMNIILAHYLDHSIQLANTRGTLWNGAGNLYGMQDMHWKISAPELLAGRVHIWVTRNDSATPMQLLLSSTRIEFRHVVLTVPAAVLAHFARPLKIMSPGGQLTISSDAFSMTKLLTGSVAIIWQNASSTLCQINPVGAYRFLLSGRGDHLEILLDTRTGPLFLAGKGVWSAQQGMHFMGTASAGKEQLAALLNLIGKPIGNNVYSLDINTH